LPGARSPPQLEKAEIGGATSVSGHGTQRRWTVVPTDAAAVPIYGKWTFRRHFKRGLPNAEDRGCRGIERVKTAVAPRLLQLALVRRQARAFCPQRTRARLQPPCPRSSRLSPECHAPSAHRRNTAVIFARRITTMPLKAKGGPTGPFMRGAQLIVGPYKCRYTF
jgi:hypothetical protein